MRVRWHTTKSGAGRELSRTLHRLVLVQYSHNCKRTSGVYVEKLVRCGKVVQPDRERDLGAIVGERFDLYLREQPFELETDHKPLVSKGD